MDNFDNIAQYPMYFAPGCKLLQLQPQMVPDVYDYLRKLFGSLKAIRSASLPELEAVLPKDAARAVFGHFHKNDEPDLR